MKRFIMVIIALCVATTLSLSTFAASVSGNIYKINDTTVEFALNSAFTTGEQMAIAEYVINRKENSSTTYNLMCTLFGHKTTTESLIVIEHRVSTTAPRCTESIVDVTACSRCDYVVTDVISSIYIFCCD